MYPKNFHEFRKLCLKNSYFNEFYHKLGEPKPFDVSLRDGLQALPIEQQKQFTTNEKKLLYNHIIYNYNPPNIEIGSCVSGKVLPIFNDTKDLFEHAEKYKNPLTNSNQYVLVPNFSNLLKAINIGFRNFSFITSVSNRFQIKNTKMSLEDSYIDINNMMIFLDDSPLQNYKTKIYVSCISKCPYEGNMMLNTVVDELVKIHKLRPNNICLSDTCGDLKPVQLYNILQGLIYNKINLSNFSLHLHVKNGNESTAEKLIHTALDYGINQFDVSNMSTGGCSVTMDKKNLAPNLSYELYYKSLVSYIENNMD